ncbi:MAG: DegV family protein [Syntrophomonadaceae bacterium]
MGIRIYTDNACDLDRKVLEELGVHCLYITTMLNGVTYLDRYDLNPPDFYRMLQETSGVPTTAQINPQRFIEEFEPVINNTDDDIIYIAFSSGLSGTYNSACIASDQIAPGRITVVDSKSASVGMGLTVIRAARAAARGLSKPEIIAEIEDNVRRIEHIFIVGNFEMLKRGGRVSATAATLGNILNIKLILHFVDGKIVPLEKDHGLKKAKKRLLEIMEERGSDLKNQLIGINHSQDLQGAMELQEMIDQHFGCQDFIISEIGAVIGSHVGAGTMSVFFLHA